METVLEHLTLTNLADKFHQEQIDLESLVGNFHNIRVMGVLCLTFIYLTQELHYEFCLTFDKIKIFCL